jgi:hypothetical protein
LFGLFLKIIGSSLKMTRERVHVSRSRVTLTNTLVIVLTVMSAQLLTGVRAGSKGAQEPNPSPAEERSARDEIRDGDGRATSVDGSQQQHLVLGFGPDGVSFFRGEDDLREFVVERIGKFVNGLKRSSSSNEDETFRSQSNLELVAGDRHAQQNRYDAESMVLGSLTIEVKSNI